MQKMTKIKGVREGENDYGNARFLYKSDLDILRGSGYTLEALWQKIMLGLVEKSAKRS